ncbi:hypothetical protein Tco_0059561 [Tanacetum coccineum]
MSPHQVPPQSHSSVIHDIVILSECVRALQLFLSQQVRVLCLDAILNTQPVIYSLPKSIESRRVLELRELPWIRVPLLACGPSFDSLVGEAARFCQLRCLTGEFVKGLVRELSGEQLVRYSNPMIQPEPEGSTQGYLLDSVEVLRSFLTDSKLKNFKKDGALKLFKSTNQEMYEHVDPKFTRFTRWQSLQDGKTRLCLVDDLKVFKITFSHTSQDKGTSSSLKSMITTSIHKLMIEVKDYELKTNGKAYFESSDTRTTSMVKSISSMLEDLTLKAGNPVKEILLN